MKLRLDESKPYAVVTPAYNGAVRHQVASDGKGYYFDAAGSPVDIETGKPLEVDVKAPKPEPVVSTLTTVTAEGEKVVETVFEPAKEEVNPRAELIKWLKGDEKAETNWMKVRSYGKEVLGRVAAGKDELVSLAIENGLVPQDQVKVD